MFQVTLEALRKAGACYSGYSKVVAALSGEPVVSARRYATYRHSGPVTIEFILRSNGLHDALWALRCVEGHDRDLRLYAVWCARQLQHLMTDKRSLAALDVAERYANGQATEAELIEAEAAAEAARASAWAVQENMLLKMLHGESPWQPKEGICTQ